MATKFGATTVASPYEFEVTTIYPGKLRTLASGRKSFDSPQSTVFKQYLLRWRQLTTAQKNAIVAEYETAIESSVLMEFPDGTTDTCFADASSPVIAVMSTGAGGSARWQVAMTLYEEIPTS